MKLLNLLFSTFGEEFYVIDNITELEVREKMTSIVSKETKYLFSDISEPLWGNVEKNSFMVWLNKFQVLPTVKSINNPIVTIATFRDTTVRGEFRNISPYNNKILLTIDFSVPLLNVIGALIGTSVLLYGIGSALRSVEQYQQYIAVAAAGFIARVVFDLRSVSDVNKARVAILEAFANRKITRAEKMKSQ